MKTKANLLKVKTHTTTNLEKTGRGKSFAPPALGIEFTTQPKTIQQKSLSPVTQLASVEKNINGLTHLVRMVNGSIYNKDYTSNEVMEVTRKDLVTIETDVKFLSRRGPNQEVHSVASERGKQDHLWYKVISVNNGTAGENVFVRSDMLLDVAHEQRGQAAELPYNFLMKNLLRIKPSNPVDHAVIKNLVLLKQKYDSIPSDVKSAEAKLRIADELSGLALSLKSEELSEVSRSLHKFPHVVLDHTEKISLDDMTAIISSIDKTRELGLLNLENTTTGGGSLGLFMGPKKPGMEGTGATVSSPGKSTVGEHLKAGFIAHTHPRELPSQQPHNHELDNDIHFSGERMEMVRAATGETMFYDKKGAKNQTGKFGFKEKLVKPDENFKYKIARFTVLPGGYEYSGAVPTESDSATYKQLAMTKEEIIWNAVLDAQTFLSKESLTREEYLHYLEVMKSGLDKLEKADFPEFTEWDHRFPKRAKAQASSSGDVGGSSFMDFL